MSLTKQTTTLTAMIKFEADSKVDKTFLAVRSTVDHEGKKDTLRYACAQIDLNLWDGENAVDLRQLCLAKK